MISVGTRSTTQGRIAILLLAFIAVAGLVFGGSGAAAEKRPEVIDLPIGFQPEGIATRNQNSFFVGSIPTGAIYRGNLRSGEGSIFVPAREGRSAIGLSQRRNLLFVAGGGTGQAYVYDARTGAEEGVFQLTTEETFVNDVVATKNAAYFTDSVNPVVYKLPIDKRRLGTPRAIPLSGDLVYEEGFNANGIDATDNGKTLVVVQSNTGRLFTVDPRSGASEAIDLGNETVTNGDGILLDNKKLWVLQNRDNLLTLVRLKSDFGSGQIVERFTDATFDVPTTLAKAGNRLAIVNARFGTPSPETAKYTVTQIPRPR
jgi:sugar lactone lactonase YvrE